MQCSSAAFMPPYKVQIAALVHLLIGAGKCLYSAQFSCYISFFFLLGVHTLFTILFQWFTGTLQSFDGKKEVSPNNALRCAGKWIPLGCFQGSRILAEPIAGVPRDGICIQSWQLFAG